MHRVHKNITPNHSCHYKEIEKIKITTLFIFSLYSPELDQTRRKWTELNQIDRRGPNWAEMNQIGLK